MHTTLVPYLSLCLVPLLFVRISVVLSVSRAENTGV